MLGKFDGPTHAINSKGSADMVLCKHSAFIVSGNTFNI